MAAKTKSASRKKRTPTKRATWATACDRKKSVKQRIAALANLPTVLCEDQAKFQQVLGILKDTSQATELRLATLRSLQAATFSAENFESCRPHYLAALREVSADPNLELRRRALGILARERDPYAQELLIKGLRNPSEALLAPEKALQLMSYDIHADAYPIAREIAAKPPSDAARREALRLLAADSSSAPVFEKILRDKKEPADMRRLSASALHSIAPEKLQSYARSIVLDDDDDDDVKATSLTALTDLGQPEAITDELYQRVSRLNGKGALKKGAQRFLRKYKR